MDSVRRTIYKKIKSIPKALTLDFSGSPTAMAVPAPGSVLFVVVFKFNKL